MAVITYRDIEKTLRLEGRLSAADIDVIEGMLIPDAEGELQAYLNRSLDVETIVGEQHLVEFGTRILRLDNTPVVSVQVVTVESIVLDEGAYLVRPIGLDFGVASVGTVWPLAVVVDYTAGLDELASFYGAIRSALRKRVAREFIDGKAAQGADALGQLGMTALAVEGYSVSWGGGANGNGAADETGAMGGFTPAEIRLCARARRRVLR